MIDVTCFQCRTKVRISPGAYECPKCQQDLRQLLSQEQVSGYFYNRASALAVNGEFQAALVEVEHGLTYYGSSELHLLAAILSQQLGRYDQMRHHVGAIPLEDSLRAEAEWLLRSHEDRRRTLREGLKVDRNVRRGGIQANRAIMVEELSGRHNAATPGAVWRTGFLRIFAVTSVVLFSLVVLVVAAGDLFPEQSDRFWSIFSFPTLTQQTSTPPATLDDTGLADGQGLESAAPTGGQPLEQPDFAMMIVAPDPSTVVETLVNAGQAGLLELPITVRVLDGRAQVEGMLESTSQRDTLSAVLLGVPGVSQVDLSQAQVDLPDTYIVQPGDTLWTVVFSIYGNVDRLDEVYEANRDVLPSRDALQPGMELRIPPP